MKKVLILGDSLTLPRFKPESCKHEDTWPVLLQDYFDVHAISIGGGTIKDLHRQLEYHIAYKPDYVIIQSGIVDCAPRALGLLELEVMQQFWVTKRLVLPIVRKQSKYLRGFRNKTYTTPRDFASYLQKIRMQLGAVEMFSIGILPSCPEYEIIVPGVTKRVKQFNEILKNLFQENFIPTDTIDRAGIMSDHIHLNKDGHQFIFNSVRSFLGNKAC
ncbi:SGNH/GDSL hydrolase family protein [Pseudochryseolinea flava]|uniref:SGNH hydrolase-type esterase domain-containing protein n=1 Tax=Pseudochryseolinea flava TaxID=2059302 RepID=A0A364Y5F9_9BACT|nr:SGNH/GDSL hydrolase family protein [Pseudochryseolinea flava]RAW01301.1 hypothetical protein DQQ10_10350 [Pseudochryseolinea flava]